MTISILRGPEDEIHSLRLTPNQNTDELMDAALHFLPETGMPDLPPGWRWVVLENRCFLDVTIVDEEGNYPFTRVFERGIFAFSELTSGRDLRRIIHVPGLRGNPERVYSRTATGPDFPGVFESYVATLIAQWQEEDDDRLRVLERMLSELGLTRKLSAKGINDTQIELQVGRLPSPDRNGSDLVSIADVGFGVSQVLPILVALLVAEETQLVYLEQPELHLHPLAQYALPQILLEAAKRGVVLVVETHSALLLRRLQTLMAQGVIGSDLVKLHWFSRDPTNGTTSIHSATLDDNGAFGDWPVDFGDVELMAEGEYLDAVESQNRI